MGTSGKNQGELKFMTLESMNKVIRRSWDTILMPDTVIDQVNAPGKGQPNEIQLLDSNKCPIGDLDITGVNDGETKPPHIELVEPDTDLDPISDVSETLPDLVEQQDMPSIKEELEQDMDAFTSLTREDGTPEAADQIIDTVVEREPPEITSLNDNDTPEANTGLCISFWVRFQTKQDHIPIMLGK